MSERRASRLLSRPGWWAYQLVMATGLLLAAPVLLLRRYDHYGPTIPGRLGAWNGDAAPRRGGLWIHAVSVGEVGVAATLARRLPPSQPSVVTTVTPTGQTSARRAFGGRASVAYLPFDLGLPIRRFFRRFEPRALVLAEGDYWPLVLRAAVRRGVPVAVVSGRVGDKSFRDMRRLRWFLGPLFDRVALFCMQSGRDAARLLELGVAEERVAVTGNLKYDAPEPNETPELAATLDALAGGRPILVAGSTMGHPGGAEEEPVLAAFQAAGGGERALLVIAPRRLDRCGAVATLLERFHGPAGVAWTRRSGLPARAGDEAPRVDVVLLDSMGELAGLYRSAAGAFIGGTLVPTGGHNPLEAARFGVPVVVGPSMDNFRDMAADFDAARAWVQARDGAALGEIFAAWLDDPDAARALGARGRDLVEANRGALDRTLSLLEPVLAECADPESRP